MAEEYVEEVYEEPVVEEYVEEVYEEPAEQEESLEDILEEAAALERENKESEKKQENRTIFEDGENKGEETQLDILFKTKKENGRRTCEAGRRRAGAATDSRYARSSRRNI